MEKAFKLKKNHLNVGNEKGQREKKKKKKKSFDVSHFLGWSESDVVEGSVSVVVLSF